MDRYESNVVKPFNLEPMERRRMYLSPMPSDIVVTVSLLGGHPDRTFEEDKALFESVENRIRSIAEESLVNLPCFNEYRKEKMRVVVDYFHNDAFALVGMCAQQEAWMVHGTYVQIGFYDPSLLGGIFVPMYSVNCAMTVYDHYVSCCDEIEPDKIDPWEVIDANEIDARDYRLFVGDFYREGAGIWRETLVGFRNMLMVKCRAVLAGEDPESEYAKFLASGKKYFLDHNWVSPDNIDRQDVKGDDSSV